MAVISFQEAQKYTVNRAGETEVTKQSLYDFQTYASAGQTSLTFFQVPQGQSGKTLADTNMELAGTLPNPKHFLLQSIEILFYPGVDIGNETEGLALTSSEFSNDVYALAKSGFLKLFIGSKDYLVEAPLGRFPSKTCLKTESAAAVTSEAATVGVNNISINYDYAVMSGRPYFVDPAVLLAPTQNFYIRMEWPAAVALPSGQNARIGVVMDGLLYRLSQ